MKASQEQNPLKMAVIAYGCYRDPPSAISLQKVDRPSYDAYALDAINRMVSVLRKLKWEEENIEKFLIKSKELAGIDNEKQNDI